MPNSLSTSTVPPVWRDQDAGDLLPAAVPSTQINDAIGLALVRCAKKRMDKALPWGTGGDYGRMTFDNSSLRGLCFVAADEVTRYLVAQGENAKSVMVKTGRSDHYFTVVNNGNSGNSAIVDATWKQFAEGTPDKPFCLAGTLGAIRFIFGTNSEIADIYRVGMQVLGQWDTYECFGVE